MAHTIRQRNTLEHIRDELLEDVDPQLRNVRLEAGHVPMPRYVQATRWLWERKNEALVAAAAGALIYVALVVLFSLERVQ